VRKAIAFWSAIDQALTFSNSKPFVPFSAVAPLLSAAIVMLARVAVIRWDEKAGLRRDAIGSQVIGALEGARDKGDRQ
jgi:hypothetical protein